jgi:hypothetical protein
VTRVTAFRIFYRGVLKTVLYDRAQANRWIALEVAHGGGSVADYTVEVR